MVKILQNVKIKTLCKIPAVCLILHIVLFVTGIDLDDIMQIDCLAAYKFFLFSIVFQWLITTFGIV